MPSIIRVLVDKTENALFGFVDGVIEMKRESDAMTGGPIVGGSRVVRMGNQPFLPVNLTIMRLG